MNQKALLREISEQSGYSLEETEQFYTALVGVMARSMSRGESVDCQPEWGRFIPKLRENPGRQENSPRREKKPHYFIQFKPSPGFEQKLFAAAAVTTDDQSNEEKPKQLIRGMGLLSSE